MPQTEEEHLTGLEEENDSVDGNKTILDQNKTNSGQDVEVFLQIVNYQNSYRVYEILYNKYFNSNVNKKITCLILL